MDIYESIFEGLGIDVRFDSNNLFSCEIKNTQNKSTTPYLLTAFRDTENLSVRLSLLIRETIPSMASVDFFNAFAEKALEPMRGGIGIGICPGTQFLVCYKIISLVGKHQHHGTEAINSLIEQAKQWQDKWLLH